MVFITKIQSILLNNQWVFNQQAKESQEWQKSIFYSLCAAYALVSLVALVQLIRIQLRVPEFRWTTQKGFHLMNFLVNGIRAVQFGVYRSVFSTRPKAINMIILDLPGLLFFSTYTLLVLFWAEIYHQARSIPIDKLLPSYFFINGFIYFTQVCIWVYMLITRSSAAVEVARLFLAAISFGAALGFMIYGGRLFIMLRRFPIESRGHQKKLHEVARKVFKSKSRDRVVGLGGIKLKDITGPQPRREELQVELNNVKKENEVLKKRVDEVLEENHELKDRVSSVESKIKMF